MYGSNTLTTGNGTTITKFVININSNYSFNSIPNDPLNLQSILMHELGHGLGLGHSIFSNSFMYPYSNGKINFVYTDLDLIDVYY